MKKIFGLTLVVGILAGFQFAKADPDTLLRAVQQKQLASRCKTEACYAYQVAVAEFKSACSNAQAARRLSFDEVANKFPEPLDCAKTPMLEKQRQNVIEKYNKLIESSN